MLLAGEKCWTSRAWPRAESVPGGAEIPPPKLVARSATENPASTVSPIRPMSSAASGRQATRPATRPQAPLVRWPAVGWAGQNSARPKMASTAGTSVSPAATISAIPMASGMARP